MGAAAVNTAGQLNHSHDTPIEALALGGNAFQRNAINEFSEVVNRTGVTTGEIIAAAAKLKMALGASKAYYDVINTLGDDIKRLIEGAVR